jgi:hypothetical protein
VDDVGKAIKSSDAITTAVQKVEDYRQQNGSLPEDVEGNKLIVEIKDGWGESLSYKREGEDNFEIRSAGRDKELLTADDISSADKNRIEVVDQMEIETGDGISGDGPVTIPEGGADAPVTPEVDLPDATPTPDEDE